MDNFDFDSVGWKAPEDCTFEGDNPEDHLVGPIDVEDGVVIAGESIDIEEVEQKKTLKTPGKNVVQMASARRFVDLIEEGVSPGTAAARIGTTLKALKSGGDMAEAIRTLLEVGHVKAEIKKEVIRAGLFKTFVEGIMSSDPAEKKIALEASKQMASDPEIGLTKEADVSVNINLGDLGTAIKGIELEGIENPFRREEKEE